MKIYANKLFKIILFTLPSLVFLIGNLNGIVLANNEEPPEEPTISREVDRFTVETNSAGIATGNPDGFHSIYSWPFSVVQIGHVIQSYQAYGGAPYFHHGIDMIAPYGTGVYTRSGGQVVNLENYTPGNDLYWEVAILDPEGYVWQYHHIEKNSIPKAIKDAFDAWKVDHNTGGHILSNTFIGNIVYWPVVSFGFRFNHIHLNILADGDTYLNPLEFHELLNDTQPPEIKEIGLLLNDAIISGNEVSKENAYTYSLYVRARDLCLSTVYYLPPYKVEISVDGNPWTTVWEFDGLPGGASDMNYVNEYHVIPPTCGNYTCRDFYIDLGFTLEGSIPGQLSFPFQDGWHTIDVRVWDLNGNSDEESFDYYIPYQIYIPFVIFENN